MQWVKKRIGKVFEKGASKAVTDYFHSLDCHHVSEVVACPTKRGNLVDCPLTRVADVPAFFRAVGIPDDADLVVSCDTGQGRTLVTVSNVNDDASEIFVLASLEGAEETTPNVRMILHKLGFPDFNFRYQGTVLL